MKANIFKNHHYVLVNLSGFINYESIDELKKIYQNQLKGQKVVFNLEGLKFVGSSGVTDFVSLLKNIEPNDLHICSAQPEFCKLFESQSLQVSSFHQTSLEAHNHIESMRHIDEQMSIPRDFIENKSS